MSNRSDRSDRAVSNRSDRPTTQRPQSDRGARSEKRRFETRRVESRRFESPRSDLGGSPTVSRPTSRPMDASATDFAELGVDPVLVERLSEDGITTPFPIQTAAIPDAVSGRDVLGRGRTGSGKTLGFGLPLLTRLAKGRRPGRSPRAIILLPTRELATQVSDVLAPLARAIGLRTVLVAGGMSYTPQLRGLEQGIDVVIGTPGRLIDLMDRGALDLGSIEITVLDEADHMADLGFLPDVTTILDAVPADGQRMLFSATLDRGVDRLVATYLTDPSTHEVDTDRASVDTMTHYLLPIAPADKKSITAEIANRSGRTVIFVRTQLGADRVAEELRTAGVMAGALHGGLPQGARNRTLEAFKNGSLPVLVATDVAARGIHVDEVGLVLQADPPADGKTYLHRAGRTARAGQAGVVVTLVLPDQRRQIRRLARDAGVNAVQLNARPGDAELAAVTGAVVVGGDRISDRDYAKLIAPRSDRGPRSGNRRAGGFGRPSRGPAGRSNRGPANGKPSGKGNGGKGNGRWNSDGRPERAAYHSGR
ncbi:DEAD/DEAH box helicase [Microlunatus sp. Gsoil 973]|uniref:DEAD/DEAH box helicase n=1 Tax=Microlunatus sp. Gsoil 973 TaxID=2672569 RepID=UPI001E467426|nr:DEAD/DEAH box helicase [Microlunatus sp. Gsoil 973]